VVDSTDLPLVLPFSTLTCKARGPQMFRKRQFFECWKVFCYKLDAVSVSEAWTGNGMFTPVACAGKQIVLQPYSSVWSTELHRWQNKLGAWVTVFSPNGITGLRRHENVKFGTKVASSTRMFVHLDF